MDYLSLFSGAGGGDLAMQHLLGFRCRGYVEYEPYCQEVIKARIADGFLDSAPIFGDIRKFCAEGYAGAYTGLVDLITGGFPCQPFSVAGKQLGEDDQRNMWPATIEAIRLVRPRLAFLENVPGLLATGYFGHILGDLAESGFDARWKVVSAAEVGAPHKRDRLWILAYSARLGWGRRDHADEGRCIGSLQVARPCAGDQSEVLANSECLGSRTRWTECEGQQWGKALIGTRHDVPDHKKQRSRWGADYWATEPELGRVAHELADGVDLSRTLKNGEST